MRARSLHVTWLGGALLLSNLAYSQTISSIVPSSVAAGSAGFVLSVSGSNFNSASIVQLSTPNGLQTLTTYFVNSNLLMAGVYANDIASPASLHVDVANEATQSSSNSVTLAVTGAGSGGGKPTPTPTPTPKPTPTPTPAPPPPPTSPGGCYGCVPGSPAPPPPPPPPTSPGTGGSTTSPPGSPLLVKVTSPSLNQTVGGSVTVKATATITSKTEGGVAFWGIFDSGKLLWVDINPDTSINVNLALSKGSHSLRVVAYDDSFTGSTATVPLASSSSGITVAWGACMRTQNGQQYQAIRISPQQSITGVLQSQMFFNSNCDPTQWTDQLNDVGAPMTLGSGSSFLFWFIHRANTPGVSAVWTMGNQTSGCVNYSSAPPC